MDRVLQASLATVEVTLYDGETPTDSTIAVTVEVVGDDGTVIVPAGTATDAGTAGDGKYSFKLQPSHTARLDRLTCKWTATIAGVAQTFTTRVEVVGGFYATLAEIRVLKDLSDKAKYPTTALITARNWAEDLVERVVGVAFVPRYARDLLDGDGCDTAWLSRLEARQLLGVRIDGVTQASTVWQGWAVYPSGAVVRISGVFPSGHRNIDLAYAHGLTAPPADIEQAALTLIRYRLLEQQTRSFDRATAINADGTTFSFAVAGANRPTGLPEVDAVLTDYAARYTAPALG